MSRTVLQTGLEQKYPLQTEGDALFFKILSKKPTFRFELPEIGWEFSNGFWIGPQIKGIFYYKEGVFGCTLPDDNTTQGSFYADQGHHDGERWVHIKFFGPVPEKELLGEFVGRDPQDISGDSGLLREEHTGEWKMVDYSIATAVVSKAPDSPLISVTAPALRKRAEFECKPTDPLYPLLIEGPGRLTIKDIHTLDKAGSARWYNDYVVFYEGHHASDFSAFFYPDKGIIRHDNIVFHNVQWWDL